MQNSCVETPNSKSQLLLKRPVFHINHAAWF